MLQIQNLCSPMEITLGRRHNVGEKPTVITLTLTAMPGHQKNSKFVVQYLLFLTLQGKDTNFRCHKLTQNKVQKK